MEKVFRVRKNGTSGPSARYLASIQHYNDTGERWVKDPEDARLFKEWEEDFAREKADERGGTIEEI
jgi:hypothetical protein